MDFYGVTNISLRYKGSLQCGKQYCDFVVWTQQGILVERIEEDTNFIEGLFRKLTKFYVDHVLPEIMTRLVVGIDEPNNACSDYRM